MKAPDKIRRLVEVFERNLPAYKSSGYKEANVRAEFIDPFFEALGWDVRNRQGWAEAYKDVITEDAIKVGGATKAPDYCFRIGGTRKFFVEAKKPSIDIKGDVSPAYQLRRYAWSAKLPLSILTDFEEFAVYDCRLRPRLKDKAGKARVMYFTYPDYLDKWEEIAGVFSRQAVLEGYFDKYVESKGKRTTQEVDAEFLKEIEEWRTHLAHNIALRNPKLGIREINFVVQRTIDRIIFLRICEDRGSEIYGQLQTLLNGKNVYQRLQKIYRQADEKYNSGLFHFRPEKGMVTPPDELTPGIKIDDKTLKDILKRLYYPESPYEFSVLGVDILGNIYEQFLGKVITLTKGHHARIEDKPEVRKAGGVYYTPTYIVDYIVENTVGKLCEGKTPKQIAKLKVLDPACGSGSFLIGVYSRLLDYHRDWYVNNLLPEVGHAGYIAKATLKKYVPDKKPEMPVYQGKGGQWLLTTREKKRILLNNIYGVDIDDQAVEVTKLSLLLKVLENENQDTLERQMQLWRERALPDLGNNIKCGNSLIGPDFYETEPDTARRGGPPCPPASAKAEERSRINAFDWNAEFPEIMKKGGFDAVIGNPPYIRMEEFKELKQYLKKHYRSHAERTDIYIYFIEKEHDLIRPQGCFGMIVSNKFIRAKYGEPLRKHLKSVATVERIVDLAGLPVFPGATVRTVVLITQKSLRKTKQPLVVYSPPPAKEDLLHAQTSTRTLAEITDPIAYRVPADKLNASGWQLLRSEYADLMDRLLKAGKSLKQVTDGKICMGIKSVLTEAFVINTDERNAITKKNPEAEQIIHPFLQGRQIRCYEIAPSNEYLIYTYHGIDMTPYPAVIEHLRPFRKRLENRATKQEWYELQQPQFAYLEYLEQPKIVFPDIAVGCRFALDTAGHFGANTVYFIPIPSLPLLGLLNSRLAFFFFKQTCAALEGPGESYLRFFGQYLENFPVCLPSESDPHNQRLAEYVERILELNNKLTKAKTPIEKTQLERQIKVTDTQINRLVYELYGLTEKEIGIVEELV